MANLSSIPYQLDENACTCRVVVETPAGSRHKYTYDPKAEAFELGSVLAEGLVLPLAFGFIPSTCAPDGDPLDVMIFFDEPVPVGLLAFVRIIGAIEGEETKDRETFRNDRLVAVARETTRHDGLKSIKDIDKTMIEQLDLFWRTRNEAAGKAFRVLRHVDAAAALGLIRNAAV